MVAPFNDNGEPTITIINRNESRSYEISTENEGQTPTITMETMDGSIVTGLLMDIDEIFFHIMVTRIETRQQERPYYFTGGRVVLNAGQFDGEPLEVGADVRFEGIPIGRVLGVATDGTFTAEINTPTTPTILRGTSDTYRIYYKKFGKEEQKYCGTKYTGYDHWLDFLEGIKKHKNKGHKIVNMYSNKHIVNEEKKNRLFKLI